MNADIIIGRYRRRSEALRSVLCVGDAELPPKTSKTSGTDRLFSGSSRQRTIRVKMRAF
jgi:hypothetical protein